MAAGVTGDDLHRLLEAGYLEKVAVEEVGAPMMGMDVGIGEARGQEPPLEVDDLGSRHEVGDLAFMTHGHDPLPLDRYRPGPGASGVGREHLAIREDDAFCHGGTV
jgi:hypothetical protein